MKITAAHIQIATTKTINLINEGRKEVWCADINEAFGIASMIKVSEKLGKQGFIVKIIRNSYDLGFVIVRTPQAEVGAEMSRPQPNEHLKAFFALLSHPTPGEELPPVKTATIKGMEIEVRYINVDRKCYDFQLTPTLKLKVSGKRISYKALFNLLKED